MKQPELKKWQAYFEARNNGSGIPDATRRAKLSESTTYRFERGDQASTGLVAASLLGVNTVGGALVPQPLNPEAVKALEDFAYFRYRFFGRRSRPWQERAAYDVLAALETRDREYVVNNEPPGSGKSTLFTCDIPCWLIARDRTIRIQVGSRTERQARMYSGRIKRALEREMPLRANADALAHGIAWDAQSCLIDDFTPFRPDGRGDLWRAEALTVRQLDGVSLDDKEPTVSAWGQDSGFLGGRFDLIIWDDLVDKKNTRNPETRDSLADWYDTEAENRLEPGGALILQGQRISGNDLYRHCLDLVNLDESKKYRHIVYKAHDDERCKEQHDVTAMPWPDGCLLDPIRLPWKMLEGIRHNNPRVYAVQYQQEDGDLYGGLAEMAWFTGGLDSEGYYAPGCLDEARPYGEVPEHLTDGRGWSIITVDPSPTEYWGIIWWVVDPDSLTRYAIDISRRRMNPEQFLSLDLDTMAFTGLLKDWHYRAAEKGAPLSHVVVEINAAQRWLVQQPHVQRWMANTGVAIVGHTTHVNKADPKFGVESTGDLYRQGLIRLPWADGASRLRSNLLINEATRYPEADTDDLVMSTWFMHLAVNNLSPPRRKAAYQTERPSWLAGTQRGWAYAR
jgi:hypothetical protein